MISLSLSSLRVVEQIGITAIIVLCLLAVHLLKKRSIPLTDVCYLPGPRPTSFLVGSGLEFCQSAPGVLARSWALRYGPVFRMTGILRETSVVISDLTAINHILHHSASKYDIAKDRAQAATLFWGKSIVGLRGEDHTRHRRVLQPAFGPVPVKGMKGMFERTTGLLVEKLDQLMATTNPADPSAPMTIDMANQLKYTTLDALWLGGFGTDLGSTMNPDSPHVAPYTGLKTGALRPPTSAVKLLVRRFIHRLPHTLRDWIIQLDKKQATAIMDAISNTKHVAERLIGDKMAAIDAGEDIGGDALGKLVKTSLDQEQRWRLDDSEIANSVGILNFAGHETSANALGWIFHFLSTHPKVQDELRSEVLEKLETSGGNLSCEELDSLPLLNAVIKETLRLHPALPILHRESLEADHIPLSQPLTLSNGTRTSTISIRKDTLVYINISAVHHDVAIWGDDAGEWKPERWCDGRYDKDGVKIPGVYSNLLTFAAGPRLCIGWRFAVLEIQTVLSQLIAHYHFNPVPGVVIESLHGAVDTVCVANDSEGFGKLPLIVTRV